MREGVRDWVKKAARAKDPVSIRFCLFQAEWLINVEKLSYDKADIKAIKNLHKRANNL